MAFISSAENPRWTSCSFLFSFLYPENSYQPRRDGATGGWEPTPNESQQSTQSTQQDDEQLFQMFLKFQKWQLDQKKDVEDAKAQTAAKDPIVEKPEESIANQSNNMVNGASAMFSLAPTRYHSRVKKETLERWQQKQQSGVSAKASPPVVASPLTQQQQQPQPQQQQYSQPQQQQQNDNGVMVLHARNLLTIIQKHEAKEAKSQSLLEYNRVKREAVYSAEDQPLHLLPVPQQNQILAERKKKRDALAYKREAAQKANALMRVQERDEEIAQYLSTYNLSHAQFPDLMS